MNFYISDLHFGHYNVLKYDNRPFSSIEEMDKKMIEKTGVKHISCVCRGERKTAGGFIWKYK